MDKSKMAVTAKRMAQARTALLMDNPFFGYLSLRLQLACAPCGTACTDGRRLIFDPEFAEKLTTDREMQFVVLHEILHCALEHITRRGSRDRKLYNLACDIVVNSTILHMWGLTTLRVADFEPPHLAPDGIEGREYNAEEVYDMLLQNASGSIPGNPGSGTPTGNSQGRPDSGNPRGNNQSKPGPGNSTGNSQGRPDSGNSPGSSSGSQLDNHDIWDAIRDESALRDAWNSNILQASRQCGQGASTEDIPPYARKIIDRLLQRTKEDWKQILHDFLQYDVYDYSFIPPDRRFSDGDFFLPAYNITEDDGSAKDLWVCIDTSGSISDKQLREVLSEVQDAMRQAGLSGSVSFFDTHITDPVPFSTEEEFREIVPTGGGGTDFHIIFQYLQEKIYPQLPRAILIFTDGYVWSWPDEADALEVPVLWLIKKGCNTDAPWGRVAELQ